MKKYSILFMAIATILFISCSKDDNDDGTWSTVEMTVNVTKVPMKIIAAGQGEKMHTDWGDGSIESDPQNAWIHTYTTPGNYKITMKVRNMEAAKVYYYYSSIHFKDCSNLESIKSAIVNLHDSSSLPKTVTLENCPNLTYASFASQNVTSLEIKNCPQIKYLYLDYHQLSSLNLDLPLLEELDCSDGALKELDLSHFPALKRLYCGDDELSSINLKNCKKLVRLSCIGSQLTELNLENCTSLEELICYGNKIIELDISKNIKLHYLKCWDYYIDENNLKTIWVWEGFDIKNYKEFYIPKGVKYEVKQ
jgi:immunoreactive 47 kDa antigen PG97